MSDFGTVMISGLDFYGGFGTNVSQLADYTSEAYKADGLVHRSNGNHTIQISASNLTANISILGTLSRNPDDGVWFEVPLVDSNGNITENLSFTYTPSVPNIPESGPAVNTNEFYTATGQYSWLKAQVTGMSHGIIQYIKLAY
jgi:hypothetical protein